MNDNENPLLGTTHICAICGKRETYQWFKSVNDRLAERKQCFTCDHFTTLAEKEDRSDCVVVDGVHYTIGNERDSAMRGCGGARFKIKFNDGREVESTNLWCQGNIPPHLRDRLPDNARFVQ